MSRNQPSNTGSNVIVGAGGEGTYVSGEMLKQVDTPVETLLGGANGALSGAVIAAGFSALATYLYEDSKHGIGKTMLKNVTGSHKWPVIAFTTAVASLGALVRFSRARNHNEWSDRHYSFLEQQQKSHAERVEATSKSDEKDSSPAR